jgi:hypothetical protein
VIICKRVSSKMFLHGNFLVGSKLCIGWWPLGGPSWALRGNDLGLTNGHFMGGHDPGVTNGHYLGGLIPVWPMAIIWVAWSRCDQWPLFLWPDPRSDQWSLCGVIGTWERFCNIIGNFVDYLPDLMMFFLCVVVAYIWKNQP